MSTMAVLPASRHAAGPLALRGGEGAAGGRRVDSWLTGAMRRLWRRRVVEMGRTARHQPERPADGRPLAADVTVKSST